jgi:hypothetical protein
MIELFHFDIETAANYKDFKTFESNDERGSKLFKDKFNRLGWEPNMIVKGIFRPSHNIYLWKNSLYILWLY